MNGLNSNDRELLARLIERFNQIENNAKRIDELPAIASLAGDSKLHVSVNGISYSMTVQELLSAIESRKYDHITFINNLEINGTTLTADSAGWVIQDVVYNLTNPFEETIPYASAGYQRTDLLIANTNNEFLVIQGDENEGISFAPPLPPNTVLVTTLDVTDNSINSSPNPIGNDNFKIKNESNFVKAVGNNPNDYIESFWLNTEASHIVLESIVEIKSLVLREGFKAYSGKQVFITNNGVSDLKIKHGHLSNVKFVFANNTDYIVKPKETVVFYLSEDLTQAHFLSSSISSGGSNQMIRAFYPSWNLSNLNTWRCWSRSTSNMLSTDANVTAGTGEVPLYVDARLPDSNYVLLHGAKKIKRVIISFRQVVVSNMKVQLILRSFDLSEGTNGRGIEPNQQVLINEQFTMANNLSYGYLKSDFIIANHELNDLTGLIWSYRCLENPGTPLGINLIIECE